MQDEVRAGLLREFRSAAEDTVNEWLRRWQAEDGASLRARYFEDGTVELEREDATSIESIRLRFGVAVIEEPEVREVEEDRPWRDVHPGWSVLAPNGVWFEVEDIPPWTEDDGQIRVTLRANGKSGTFPRDPAALVRVRFVEDAQTRAEALLAEAFGAVVIGRS